MDIEDFSGKLTLQLIYLRSSRTAHRYLYWWIENENLELHLEKNQYPTALYFQFVWRNWRVHHHLRQLTLYHMQRKGERVYHNICRSNVFYISNTVLLVECTGRLWCIGYRCFCCLCSSFCGKFRSLNPARCRFCTSCWSFVKICSHCYQKYCCYKTGKSLYELIISNYL